MPNMKKTGKVKPQKIRVKKEMISDKLRGALTKQGYHLVGSHSGVKICRWTKSQLRGRGGCYKHSFYGIESHRCMEATPSLGFVQTSFYVVTYLGVGPLRHAEFFNWNG